MTHSNVYINAPEIQASEWLNTDSSICLESLRGKVVVIEAFQMLCPGCVLHGIPQAKEIAQTFSNDQVVVLGLHSVFEHHDAMQPVSLKAFVHEYGINFPIAIDAKSNQANQPIPKTMQAYNLRGTPSMIVVDQLGLIRINRFGRINDMAIAAGISNLLYSGKS